MPAGAVRRYSESVSILRTSFVNLWLAISCGIGLIRSLWRWKDPDLNHDTGRLFAALGLPVAGVRVEVEGRSHLDADEACVLVANHQHSIDVLTFASLLPRRTIGIGKKELIWIPFFGLYFLAAGNVLIDRQNRARAVAGLERAVETLRKRRAKIFIFPEGTRNRQGRGLLPFKKGAFHMAIEAQVPVVAIVSGPVTRELTRHGGVLRMKVLPPIPTRGMAPGDAAALSERTRTAMLEAFRELGGSP